MHILSNPHTHSTASDGKSTLAEMAASAFERGFVSLGFSDHSPQAFHMEYAIGDEPGYIDAVRALKAHYAGRMKIWLGIELDVLGFCQYDAYDYILGAVHYLRADNRQIPVDGPVEWLRALFEGYYKSDGIAMARDYYETVALAARQLKPDILAHFDLIRKNNHGAFFSSDDAAYRKVAVNALADAFPYTQMLEINTGGMARGYLGTPYPEQFLLEAWREMGGRIILSSDSHRADTIDFAFADALALARAAGYRSAMRLGAGEALFEEVEL